MMTSAPRNSIPSGEIPSLNIVAVHTDRSISTGGMKARTVQPSLTWYNYHDVHPLHFSYLITIHALGIVGPMFAPFNWGTFLFGIAYGHVLGLGVTAGYHRLWAHRSYNGSVFLQYLLAAFGAGALQRDIVWWCRQHRLHHRYTDTDLDPYNAKRGFWYSHIGWLIFRQRIEPISVDVSDLKKNPVIQWQRRNYYLLVLISSFIIPGFIPWYFWGETVGGCFVYAIVVRICLLLHVSSSFFLPYSILNTSMLFPSSHHLSTLLLIGLGRLLLTTSIPLVTTSSLHFFPSVKDITISITSSPWTIAVPSNGTNSTRPNGLSGHARCLGLLAT
jgi:fatty-acid desaturase